MNSCPSPSSSSLALCPRVYKLTAKVLGSGTASADVSLRPFTLIMHALRIRISV